VEENPFKDSRIRMKNGILIIFILLMACSKHEEPGFTSVAGNWLYSTPDGEVSVTFELAKTSTGGFIIQNQTMTINKVLYNSYAQLIGVNLPVIQQIEINANDILAIYPYEIAFNNCTVSSDFTTINVPAATYTWPWGTTNMLSSIKIVRQ
jgi:hypothetical protein